jgi:hypothetical protein
MKLEYSDYTINQLKVSKDPFVYVINTSDTVHRIDERPIKGTISIPIKTGTGESVLLRVPSTWIPVDLSTFADKNDIQNSPRFRSMLRNHEIALLSTEDAERILATPEAQRELRVLNKHNSVQFNTDVMAGKTTEKERDSLIVSQGELEELQASPLVVDALGRDDLSDDERYSIIYSQSEHLVENDWKYIMDSKSSSSDLKELALEHLTK